MVNVKDMGARGDGWTDDSAALTAALAQGGEVYVPPGIYPIGKSVELTQSGTRFYGVPRQSILRLHADSRESVLIVPKRWEGNLDPAYVVKDIEIRDLVLDGNLNPVHNYPTEADYFGLFIRQAANIRLSGLIVRNVPSDGITVSNGTQCRNLVIEDCVVHGCRRNGIHLGSVVGAVIRRCHIYDVPCQREGWDASAAAAIDLEVEGLEPCGVFDVLIEDCTLERYDGTRTAGAGIQISPAYGPCGRMVVRRCLIRNHQIGVSVAGSVPTPEYDKVVRDVTIEDCTILDDNIHVTGYGVFTNWGAAVKIRRNLHRSHFARASLAVSNSADVEICNNHSISPNWFLEANQKAAILLAGNRWVGWFALLNVEGDDVCIRHNDERSGIQVQTADPYAAPPQES